MEIPTILQSGDSALRKESKTVAQELIGGKSLTSDIEAMKQTLRYEYDGVAIAAPQIGILKRIFVVSGRVFDEDGESHHSPDMVCINPEITKTSKKSVPMDEGCLSVRYVYGAVKRHTHVTLEYTNEEGVRVTRGAGGLLAHIFQHEVDHLNGTLFIDKAEHLEELKGADKKELDRKREEYVTHLHDNKQ